MHLKLTPFSCSYSSLRLFRFADTQWQERINCPPGSESITNFEISLLPQFPLRKCTATHGCYTHTRTHTQPQRHSTPLLSRAQKVFIIHFSIYIFTLNKNTNRFYLIDLTKKCTTWQYNIPHTWTRYVYSLHAIYMQPKITFDMQKMKQIYASTDGSMAVESCWFSLRLKWITAFGSRWIYFQSQSSVIPVPHWMDLPQVAWTSRRTIQRRFVNYLLNWAKKQNIFTSWFDFFFYVNEC